MASGSGAVGCCIAGGGPAGMMLGLLLARAGVSVKVLEKHADFLRDFRGDTIHPSTLDLMHELGILEEFLQLPHQEVPRLTAQFGDLAVTIADFTRLRTACRFIALMPQWDFLDFLARHAKRYPSFRLEMQAEATGLIEEAGRVIGLRGTGPAGPFEVRADLVVAADGRSSTLRERAGLRVEDLGAPMDVFWFRLSRRPRDPAATMGRFDLGRIFVVINRGEHWQCGFVIPKGSAEEVRRRGLDAFRAAVAQVAPFAADRVGELRDWEDVKLLTVEVDRLRHWYRAGLLCIGDAAHAMSPVGGVGINLAIHDAPEPARFTSPGTYTPPHLARRILDSREALEGERKQVTVLFADVHGFVEMLGDRDPEEIGPVIDRVRELMMEAVHRYEGTVNQVMGDGIMALFGAPLANEDHAVRACYAALRMQAQVTAFGDELQRSLGLPMLIRVGLNSGEVVARSIGRDLSFTYTAVGQTVHLAARMEQMAKPASILATEHTVVLARGRVAARALGPVPVRGLHAPVEVHEISGAVPIRSRLDAASPRARSPLVGREALLARLDAALDAMLAGTGQVVSMVGEAGVGKSRLCLEFARRCRARGCLVIEAPAISYGRAAGYRPGVELHRRYFQLESGDEAATIRDKVAARLRALDPELEEGVSAILWVLGVPQDQGYLEMDPALRRRQVMRTVHRLATRQGRLQPFVMILEDMQWVDSETHAAMDALVEALPPYTLVASTYRPEYVDRWSRHPGFTEVRVDALEPPATGGMLAALLGGDPGLAPLKRLVADRANGNPLFLEECVASLVETGALAGERGAYRLTRPILSLEVPATVRATIASRIDRLRYEDKRLLQAASVIGDTVPVRLLETVADVTQDEVRGGLNQLQAAGLLDQRALFPDLEYGFRHALVHDVAYESLLHERRRILHARILEAIERLYEGSRLVEQTERLAHHAFLGEVWDRAVGYCRQAGARTLARMASWESVSFFERALAALAHRPADPVARATGVDLRCDLHNALVPLGQHARSVAVLREAAALAETLDDRGRLARTLSFESNVHWELGDSDEAARVGARALTIAEATRDLGLQIVGTYNVGAGRRALGDYRQALTVLRRNLALLPPSATGESFGLPGIAAVLTRSHLAWTLAELGQFDEAVGAAEEGLRLAEEWRDTYSLTYALLGLGGTLVRRGQVWEAKGVLERGIALCAEMPAFLPPFAGDLAIVYALTGRIAEALDLAERAVRQARSMQRLGRLALIITHLGEVRLLAGQGGAAEAEGRRALELAEGHKERGNMVYALRLLGRVAAEGNPPDAERARGHHAEALALAGELGMRPLAARCHLGLGHLARRAGDAAGAEKHLATARALFQEMRMTWWLERLEDQMGATATGLPEI